MSDQGKCPHCEIFNSLAVNHGLRRQEAEAERDELRRQLNELITACYYRTKLGKVHWKIGRHFGTSIADETEPAAYEEAIAAIRRAAKLPLEKDSIFADWRVGLRVTPRLTSHPCYGENGLVRWVNREKCSDGHETMAVELWSTSDQIMLLHENCDDWITAEQQAMEGLVASGGIAGAP